MNIFKTISFFLIAIPFIINADGKQPFTPTYDPDRATSATKKNVDATEPAYEPTSDITEIISGPTSAQDNEEQRTTTDISEEQPLTDEEFEELTLDDHGEIGHIRRTTHRNIERQVYEHRMRFNKIKSETIDLLPKQVCLLRTPKNQLYVGISLHGLTMKNLPGIQMLFEIADPSEKLHLNLKGLPFFLRNFSGPSWIELIKSIIKLMPSHTEELCISINNELRKLLDEIPSILQDISTSSKDTKRLHITLDGHSYPESDESIKKILRKTLNDLLRASSSLPPQLQTIKITLPYGHVTNGGLLGWTSWRRAETLPNFNDLETEFGLAEKNIQLTVNDDPLGNIVITITIPPHEQDNQEQPSENHHECN